MHESRLLLVFDSDPTQKEEPRRKMQGCPECQIQMGLGVSSFLFPSPLDGRWPAAGLLCLIGKTEVPLSAVSHSLVLVTHSQQWSRNIKWKIPDDNNSSILCIYLF